mgnify:CR=1 FL=1|tara:strand:- start:24490 stop:26682 length:2193 start_codon:yes stop_codon:yes gene_type:complete
MKTKLQFTAMIMLISLSLSAQNLVTNGDFETAGLAGWAFYGADANADAHTGLGSARLKQNQSGLTSVAITVVPGTTYDMSFAGKWVTVLTVPTSWFSGMAMAILDASDNSLIHASALLTESTYTVISEQFTVPAGVTEIKVSFYRPKLLLPIMLIDDVSVSAVPTLSSMISIKDGDWDDASAWYVSGPVASVPSTTPTAEYDVIIKDNHKISINSNVNAECNNLITGGGYSETRVNAGGTLIVNENITISKDTTFHVLSSLTQEAVFLLKGNYDAGTDKRIKYTRILDENSTDNSARKWFLVSNPFKSLSKTNSLDLSDVFTNTTNGDGSLQSIGTYDNSQVANSKYVYRASFDASDLVDGKGYVVAVNNAGAAADITFSGFYNHDIGDVSQTLLTYDATQVDGFNLVGNPYLSYIHTNALSDATHNFFDDNNAVLAQKTLWLWDGNNSSFSIVNEATAHSIAPGQAFFVETTAVKAGNLSFDKDLQTITSNGNVLSKTSNNRFEIDLSVSVGKLSRKTSILYIDNKTTSFDNGYDSTIFGGFASALEVYTGLVEGGSAKKLGIQSLPNANFEDMVVPVGVIATANSEITFSAEALNIPEGYKLFIEDRLMNVFTRLDELNSKYKVTITDQNTDGRFFLHTSATSALSVDDSLLNSVSIYKTDNSTLRVVGLQQGKASVKLFNVLGKQVMNSSFSSNGVVELSLPSLAKGVYIIQLETGTGTLNKKIILE